MKNCIFTTYNFQIDQKIIDYQSSVLKKLIGNLNIDFIPLRYNLPRRYILHYQALDYGMKHIIPSYDNILILDTDCIPLSADALSYTFSKISQGRLIGTAQRSMHIENNKHIYVGSPCIGFSRETFEKIGYPSFIPTHRGDTAEEFTYLCEEKSLPVEIFRPVNYESEPFGGPAWELENSDSKYGIGTTFVDSNNRSMFYHLFESRRHVHNQLFYNQCEKILNERDSRNF